MRDPLSWSLPIARLFGITVRVHVLFPFVAVGLILRAAFPPGAPPSPGGVVLDACMLLGLLFVSVFLHEFGHCFGARSVGGDAHEVLLWPLGGLASLELPHRPWAHFVAVAAGPLTNVFLCVLAGLLLQVATGWHARPPLNPLWDPFRHGDVIHLDAWRAGDPWEAAQAANPALVIGLAWLFFVNWVLLLINLLPGFPLDGGRLAQCALWPRFGFRQATLYAVTAGFVTMLVVGVYAVWVQSVLALLLAIFIYFTCRQHLIVLENGGEDALFGYDFSQGYTSLEGDAPPRRRPRPSFVKQWLQRRAQRRVQREQERREAEEQRMDQLLEKVQRDGLAALTDEERRFLKRVSDRYRNRQ